MEGGPEHGAWALRVWGLLPDERGIRSLGYGMRAPLLAAQARKRLARGSSFTNTTLGSRGPVAWGFHKQNVIQGNDRYEACVRML